jgi:hypothetical protein
MKVPIFSYIVLVSTFLTDICLNFRKKYFDPISVEQRKFDINKGEIFFYFEKGISMFISQNFSFPKRNFVCMKKHFAYLEKFKPIYDLFFSKSGRENIHAKCFFGYAKSFLG